MKGKIKIYTAICITVVLLQFLTACASTAGSMVETNPKAEAKRQAKMLKGFRKEMREDLLDPTRALIDFYPAKGGGFAAHYWGLLFIRQIDEQSVVYDGYDRITGSVDYFYLTPGEHTISNVRWQNVAVVGGQDTRWADDLAITYNFEAEKYYKLWAEQYAEPTAYRFIYASKVRLVITPLN